MTIKQERKYLKIAEGFVKKWRTILLLDPLWNVEVDIFDDEELPGASARVNTGSSEYYIATIELSYRLFQLSEEIFRETLDDIISHELLHILLIDYYRTSQTAAGSNKSMKEELIYKYEQFTTRLQKCFVWQEKDIEQLNEELNISKKLNYELTRKNFELDKRLKELEECKKIKK